MANPVIEKLRQAIDAKHAEALASLTKLATYLEDLGSPATNGQGQKGKKPSPRAGTGKIRNAVIAAFREEYLPVDVVAERIKKTPLQVRGVVLSPAIKKQFSKKEVDGVMHYKYEGATKE